MHREGNTQRTIKSYKLSDRIFPHHVQEYIEASKTLLHHKTTALFHVAGQLSLELHKHHNLTIWNSQNIRWMIKEVHSHKLTHTIKLSGLLN